MTSSTLTPNPGAVMHHCANGVDTSFVALGWAKIAFLGVVQGITELLPVSSTAHMRAIPALLGWPDPGSAFSAAMQLAALAAVLAYFSNDIKNLCVGASRAIADRDWSDRQFRLAIAIIVATIPIVIAGALLAPILNACGSPLRRLWVVGAACIVMALLLAAAELFTQHRRAAKNLSLHDALLIGLAQTGALIPGVSRSGASFTSALALGFSREDAARVSFLLGIPAIALAGLRELWALHQATIGSHAWAILSVGLITSTASSFLAIWGLMRFLERRSTWPLIVYRALFGVGLLALAYWA